MMEKVILKIYIFQRNLSIKAIFDEPINIELEYNYLKDLESQRLVRDEIIRVLKNHSYEKRWKYSCYPWR